MIPPLLFFLYMLYGIPSYILYWIIFIQMYKKSNKKYFSSSFFRLSKVIAGVDLFNYVVFTIIFRAPLCPLFGYLFEDKTGTFFIAALYFGDFYTQYIRGFLIMFSSINRTTALMYPTKHENIWRQIFWPTVALSFGISFAISFFYLFDTMLIRPFNPGKDGYYAVTPIHGLFTVNTSLIMLIYYCSTGAITVISNGISLGILVQQNMKQNKGASDYKQFRKSEIGLLFVSMGDIFTMIVNAFIQGNLNVLGLQGDYDNPLFDTLYLQIPWVVDLKCLSRPFLLLFMSKNVRIVFVKAIFCGHFSAFIEQHQNPIVTNINSRATVSTTHKRVAVVG